MRDTDLRLVLLAGGLRYKYRGVLFR